MLLGFSVGCFFAAVKAILLCSILKTIYFYWLLTSNTGLAFPIRFTHSLEIVWDVWCGFKRGIINVLEWNQLLFMPA